MEILLFQNLHGCNRSCSLNCLSNLFVYSISSDSVLCIHCALFVSQEIRKNLNTFVNVGCSDFNDDPIVFGHFHDNSSMSNTSLLGRSFPYISMICWYQSLPSGTLVITVGIKNKSLETECDNLVNLNSSSLIIYQ